MTVDRRDHRQTDWTLRALLVLMGVLVLFMAASSYREAQGQSHLLSYSTCSFEDFGDGSCNGDPNVDPATLTLDADLAIGVAGEVFFTGDQATTYNVEVFWLDTAGTSQFQLISVPIEYEPGAENAPYSIEWTAPNQLLGIAATLEPCSPVGSWRIVGKATPVDRPSVASYSWDSVETFHLVTPGCSGGVAP